MATVLLTWELGGGLGHLVNLLPLVKGLCERGHRVFAALRDLSRAETMFRGTGVSYLQAPVKTRAPEAPFYPPRTFPHILHNSGFGNVDELRAMVGAWRSLYEQVRPDLIVFDHSPTALLAARANPARQALIGTGFFCPLDEYPLPDLRPWLPPDPDRLRRDEDAVLETANKVLASLDVPRLERISKLYCQADEHFLVTFPELDHYPGRQGVEYWGVWPHIGGCAPVWPEGPGKRIFAYLKPFPDLNALLALLRELRCPTLVVSDGIDEAVHRRFQSATLRFEGTRIDMKQASRECDLAILNGNAGTTASMLLAGKPTLQLPIFLEQSMLAGAVVRLGAGPGIPPMHTRQVATALQTLLGSDRYAEAARRFAEKYAGFDAAQRIADMLDRAEELARQ